MEADGYTWMHGLLYNHQQIIMKSVGNLSVATYILTSKYCLRVCLCTKKLSSAWDFLTVPVMHCVQSKDELLYGTAKGFSSERCLVN